MFRGTRLGYRLKEARRKERALKKDNDSAGNGKRSQETRKISDSRRRTPLVLVFPGEMSELQEDERRYDEGVLIPSIVTIEEATVDGH